MTGTARHFAPLRPFDIAQDMLGGIKSEPEKNILARE